MPYFSMNSRRPNTFQHIASGRSLQTFPPDRHTPLVRRPGGFISVPRKLQPLPSGPGNGATGKLTKLLLNVNIERSLGPVQVIMSPENMVKDLIKTAVEIYVKEKRRPLLNETDPGRFQLHYSQFSLESLKEDEKLINLGSRNFFLCSKGSISVNCSCSEEAQMAIIKSPFPFISFMDFLL